MQKRPELHWLSDYRTELYGLAILWVMIFHGYDWAKLDYSFGIAALKPIQNAITFGNSGVDIFLLLSGISLYFSFSKSDALLPFYKKRYLRLFPALWIINSLYWGPLFVQDCAESGVVKALSALVLRLTQLSFWLGGDLYMWYVPAIAAFYFLYPAIFKFIYETPNKAGRRTALLVGLTLLFVFAFALHSGGAYQSLYKKWEIAITRLPIFLIGCGLGKAVKDRKTLSPWWLLLPIALLLGAYAAFHFVGKPELKELYLWRYGLSAIGFGVTALGACFFRLLSWKPLHAFFCFFGKMSLELYLSHRALYALYLLIRTGKSSGKVSFAEYIGILIASVLLALLCTKIESVLLPNRSSPKNPSVATK